MQKFPIYSSHNQAVCFSCESPLENPRDVDYPKGEGKYCANCINCHYRTHYDLEPPSEMMSTSHAQDTDK